SSSSSSSSSNLGDNLSPRLERTRVACRASSVPVLPPRPRPRPRPRTWVTTFRRGLSGRGSRVGCRVSGGSSSSSSSSLGDNFSPGIERTGDGCRVSSVGGVVLVLVLVLVLELG